MNEPLPPEFLAHNEAALAELAWAIESASGQFSLMLARCNYLRLREQLVEQLRHRCAVDLQVLTLQPAETALYTRIQAAVEGTQPGALLVFGLETVTAPERLLSTANQVREEFRKNFPFPIVLWLTDEGLKRMVQHAPDFESWAGTTTFTLPPTAFSQMLQQVTEHLFGTLLAAVNGQSFEERLQALQLPGLQLSEVPLVFQELQNQPIVLEPSLQADIALLSGFTAPGLRQALTAFQQSLAFWQSAAVVGDQQAQLKTGLLLFYRSQTEFRVIEQERQLAPDWPALKAALQEAMHRFEQAQRSDLATHCLLLLQRVVQKQQDWTALSLLASQALARHQAQGNVLGVVQDYGFQARAALEQQQPTVAYQAAQAALQHLTTLPATHTWLKSLQLLFLAQAEQQLGQPLQAIAHLRQALSLGDQGRPSTYIRILRTLQTLYFERGHYRLAFRTKRQCLSVEQQYGIRAFVGAGRIQPRREIVTAAQVELQSSVLLPPVQVAPEIAAAGRQQDLDRLLERIGRSDGRLIVIHGYSGVGKSSLVNAGLVPTLQRHGIGTRSILPVVLRVYTNWLQDLSQQLSLAHETPPLQPQTPDTLLEQLRRLDYQDQRVVLIFDQFEEFFFMYTQLGDRRTFFEFLAHCLQLLSLNVVISLREDYLHLLLECNRLPAMTATGIDVVSRNVLYGLGNFSPADAKGIIESLTACSQFYMEPALIKALVTDLADDLGEVRPIELQIIGAQLQTEQITTLENYRFLGPRPKTVLVEHYLAEVIHDCGMAQSRYAELILYLLTDAKGIRPLKTRAELEKELRALTPHREPDQHALDLVLEILVDSGLVVLLPEVPADRYQLVHDYLATFIRQQQEPKLSALLAELEQERQQRQRLEAQRQQIEGDLAQAEAKLITVNRKATQRERLGVGVLLATLILVIASGAWASWFVQAANQKIKAEQQMSNKQIKVTKEEAERKTREANQLVQTAQEKVQHSQWQVVVAAQTVVAAKREQLRVQQISRQAVRQAQQAKAQTYQAQSEAVIAEQAQQQAQLRLNVAKQEKMTVQKGADLERQGVVLLRLPRTKYSQLDTLMAAMQLNQGLRGMIKDKAILANIQNYPAVSPLLVLRTAVNTILQIAKLEGRSPSFSPDSKYVMTTAADGLRLYNLAGQQVAKLEGSSPSFSPDSKYVMTTAADGLRLYNLAGQQVAKLEGSSPSFSPDSKYVMTTAADGLRLYNLAGQQVAKFEGSSPSFSPDSKYVMTTAADRLRLYNLTGQQVAKFEGSSPSFSPDSKYVMTTAADGLRLYNLTGQQVAKFEGSSPSFSPDSKYVMTTAADGLRLYNLAGQQVAKFEGSSPSFSPDSKYVMTTAANDLNPYDLIDHLAKLEDGSSSFSLNSKNMATHLYDLAGQQVAKFEGNSPSFSPDSKYVMTTAADGLRLYDLAGQQVAKFEGSSPSFSPDSKYVMTTAADGLRLYDLAGQQVAKLENNSFSYRLGKYASSLLWSQESYGSSRFSPNAKYVITVTSDSSHLYQVPERLSFQLRNSKAVSSPDGNYVMLVANNSARLYNLAGQQVAELEGHLPSFSPDSKYVVTIAKDGPHLYDITSRQVAKLGSSESSFNSVGFRLNYNALLPDKGSKQVVKLEGSFINFSPDSKYVVISPSFRYSFNNKGALFATSKSTSLYDREGKQVVKLEGSFLGFSPNSKYVVTIAKDGPRLYDVTGKLVAKLLEYFSSGTSQTKYTLTGNFLGFSPDSKYMLTNDITFGLATTSGRLSVGWEGKSTGSLRLYDLAGKLVAAFEGTSPSFSPDGKYLVATVKSGSRLYDLAGKQVAAFEGTSPSFSPDGKYLVATVKSGSRLYDLAGKQVAAFEGTSPGFSPDGKYLVTTVKSGSRLYDLTNKQVVKRLQGRYFSFSSDRQRILTSSNEEDISRVYDVSGDLLAEYPGSTFINDRLLSTNSPTGFYLMEDLFSKPNITLGFTKDDKKLLTLSNDGILQAWSLDRGFDDLLARGCSRLQDYLMSHSEELKKLEVCRSIVNRK